MGGNRALAVAATCVLTLMGCGGDDDEEGARTARTSSLSSEKQTVRHDTLPFTFQLPGDFARAPRREGFIVVYGLDPLNVVDVRRAARTELSLPRIEKVYRDSLDELGFKTGKVERESVGALRTVRFTVNASSGGQDTRSNLYFFALGGQTWELECQSTETLRQRIDEACRSALATVRRRGT